MRMVERKSHLSKLEVKGFECFESCNTGIYYALPSKAFVSALCYKLKSHPIISCIILHKNHLFRYFFIAEAIRNKLLQANHIASTGCLRLSALYEKGSESRLCDFGLLVAFSQSFY